MFFLDFFLVVDHVGKSYLICWDSGVKDILDFRIGEYKYKLEKNKIFFLINK